MAKVKPGDTYRDKLGTVKAMVVADKWVMCRRPRCLPFCIPEAEFRNRKWTGDLEQIERESDQP